MTIEQTYSERVGLAHRKRFAQFFTPAEVAEVMAEWLLGTPSLRSVLEPAFGLGIFSRTLLRERPDITIKGMEVDGVVMEEALRLFPDEGNISLQLQDYLYNDWENNYDGIICNPPYFKFHDYDNGPALIELRKRLNADLSGFTNVHTLFLLKAVHQLAPDGRAAFILPSEFMNSDYGREVKRQLIRSGTLRHVIVFDFKENVFDNALTTSAIILLSNDSASQTVTFTTVNSMSQMKDLDSVISPSPEGDSFRTVRMDDLNPDIKWRAYYQPQQSLRFRNLIPFSSVAKVVRGIATGANDYFVFNRSKALQHGIADAHLLPCVTKSKDVTSPFFTDENFISLTEADRNVYLLDTGRNPTDDHVLRYIEEGERTGIHQKFLCAQRKPWHILENRPPAPIWVGVFHREGMKFIRNEAGISNLTTFHCIYPKADLFDRTDIDLLFAYLLTDVSKELFSDNQREYGDGLRKFEPNDLNHGMMPDLSLLSDNEVAEIRNLFISYRDSCLAGEPDGSHLKGIEEVLLNRFCVDEHAVHGVEMLTEA